LVDEARRLIGRHAKRPFVGTDLGAADFNSPRAAVTDHDGLA
jgi:hypothetical protein